MELNKLIEHILGGSGNYSKYSDAVFLASRLKLAMEVLKEIAGNPAICDSGDNDLARQTLEKLMEKR